MSFPSPRTARIGQALFDQAFAATQAIDDFPSAADPETATYRLIESTDRVIAVDSNDVEICGAFKPAGHDSWTVYPTVRLTEHQHHVYACTRQAATLHVELFAELFCGGER